MTVELVVAADAVVTADGDGRVLEPGWVGVRDGVIVAVEPGPAPADHRAVARAGAVIPGLVSAHQHLVDVLVRGGPTGPTFLDWLLGTYHAGLSPARPDECGVAIAAVRAAGLAAGVTTVVDCWSVGRVDDPGRVAECAEASVQAHRASGGRTVFAPMLAEVVPEPWLATRWPVDPHSLCRPADESLATIEELAARHHRADGGRTRVAPSPELPELMTPEGLKATARYAASLGGVMPIHFCASPESRAACGPADLDALGVLDDRLLAAHCRAVDAADVELLGRASIGVVQCPNASLALGSLATTPVAALRARGARVGLGLDNASLQPSSDLFAEARAALGVSAVMGAPIDAETALALVTSEGAAAAGLDGEVGSLAPGLRADLVLLDTSGPHWSPRPPSWPSAVVTCARTADVVAVYVDGEVVAHDGRAVTEVDTVSLDRAGRRLRGLRGWDPRAR